MHLISSFLALTALTISFVEAHTAFTALFVNGESQGSGTCIRMNTVSGKSNSPIGDIQSNDITCGYTGLEPVGRTCPIKVGDTVSFQFRDHPGSDTTTSIDKSHIGPCAIYAKQISTEQPAADGSFPDDSPEGDGWFKLMWDARDSDNQWCTTRLIQSVEGVISVKIPTDLKSGYYLLRPELLALHQASQGDPQFYTGCAQVYIDGGSGTAKPETVAIPGYVKYTDEAMKYNVFSPQSGPYPEFGPKVYTGTGGGDATASGSASSTSPSSTPTSLAKQNTPDQCSPPKPPPRRRSFKTRAGRSPFRYNDKRQGQDSPFACPKDTVLQLGNLCLPEAPHWDDKNNTDVMRGCWASGQKCWEIADTCWKGSNPAVNNQKPNGCNIYAAKCEAINKACQDKVATGPADEGKDLSPKRETIGGWGVMHRLKRRSEDIMAKISSRIVGVKFIA